MESSSNNFSVRAVQRAFKILKCFSQRDYELTLGQISEMTLLPKSTTHRILQTMESEGFIEQDSETGKYHLSFAFLALADVAREAYSDVVRLAKPEMEQLSQACEQTTNLYIASEGKRICIAQVQGPRYVSRYSQIGNSRPLYCGASGRVILANMDEEKLKEYINGVKLERYTDRTICSKKELLRSIEETRRKGYAVTYSEREMYTASIAAPIYDGAKRFVAALAVSGPDTMFGEENTARYVKLLLGAVREISEKMGYGRV